MLQTQNQHAAGEGVAPANFTTSGAPAVDIEPQTQASGSPDVPGHPTHDTAGSDPTRYEAKFANKIAQATNSALEGHAIEVNEHGEVVLETALTGDGVVPVVRNGIDPIPVGSSYRTISATMDDLEAIDDLGRLAQVLNMNMVRGDNPRALALLAKVKDLNPAGMAAYTWGTSPLVPPPPLKPKGRAKRRRSGPRVVFPNIFAAFDDQPALESNERARVATEPSKASETQAAHQPPVDEADDV